MKARIVIPRLIVFFLLGAVSCRTPQVITAEKIKSISTNRLIKSIEENTFNYDWFSVKRIACQYETPDNKTSFRANLKTEKDSCIWLSFNKLNLPVGRLMLTPDSVKFINYIDKNYFMEGYSYFSKFVNANVDFNLVQSVISNSPFSYRDDEQDNDYREFVSYTDSGMYVLQSFKNRKLVKVYKKGKEDKIDRYLKKLDEDEFVIQYLYVDPVNFKVRKIIIDDQSNSRKVEVNFSGFTAIDDQLYPENIDIHFTNLQKELKMRVKLSKFSLEEDLDFSFNIPEKYTLIK